MKFGGMCHFEIVANDPEKASAFYGELFGWEIKATPMGDGSTYHMISATEGSIGGGIMKAEGGMQPGPGGFVPYLLSEDIEATLAKAGELGAKTVAPKTQIPGIGYYAVFADPDGNLVGLFSE